MKNYQPGDVKRDPETKSSATKCDPGVTVGEWFVFNPVSGGHYASSDDVADWADLTEVG